MQSSSFAHFHPPFDNVQTVIQNGCKPLLMTGTFSAKELREDSLIIRIEVTA
jgi:hypothetical protein